MAKKDAKNNDEEILSKLDQEMSADEGAHKTEDMAGNVEDELVQANEKADDLFNELQKERASFINYKRRTEQEVARARGFGASEILFALLPSLDALDRAKADISEPLQKIINGIQEVFKRFDIVSYGEIGDKFDVKIHEAILDVPAEDPAQSEVLVKEIVELGYKRGDDLIRAAKVITSSPVENSAKE